MISRFSKPKNVASNTNSNTSVKPTTNTNSNTSVKATTNTNINTSVKPTTNTNINTSVKPITTTSNQNENNVIDLDNEIPNYTKMIKNASKTAVDNVTMIAGKFISQQWNELKNTLQKMSIGMNVNSPPINNTQTGGGRRRKTRKYKKSSKKTRKNYKK